MTIATFFNKQVQVGPFTLSMREFTCWVAIGLWIANMILKTGGHGFMSLMDFAIFLAVLLLCTALTRTVRMRTLLSMFALGGFTMGLEAFICHTFFGNSNFVMAFVVPFLENGIFLAPPAVLLWFRRKMLFSLGASDVMLMMAASASGFFLVEEAFIRMGGSWHPGPFWFFPSITQTGDRIFGDYLVSSQPVWGAVAGISVGLALLSRGKNRAWFWPVASVGIVLGLVDHVANNYGATRNPGLLKDLLTTLMLGGWVVPIMFIFGLVASVGVDLWMIYRFLPNQFHIPPAPGTSWRSRWESHLDQRALAYEHFYAQKMTGDDKYVAEVLAGMRAARMLAKYAEVPEPAAKHQSPTER